MLAVSIEQCTVSPATVTMCVDLPGGDGLAWRLGLGIDQSAVSRHPLYVRERDGQDGLSRGPRCLLISSAHTAWCMYCLVLRLRTHRNVWNCLAVSEGDCGTRLIDALVFAVVSVVCLDVPLHECVALSAGGEEPHYPSRIASCT